MLYVYTFVFNIVVFSSYSYGRSEFFFSPVINNILCHFHKVELDRGIGGEKGGKKEAKGQKLKRDSQEASRSQRPK